MSERCEECGATDGVSCREGCVTGGVNELAAFANDVNEVCDDVAAMLIEKNRAYGNSALDPVRVFSRASVVEQLLVRIDDKLSRLARGSAAGEDVERDLMGYLVLLRVARKRGA